MADLISKDLIQNLRDTVQPYEVVSKYVHLTKSGKNYFGLCPFHQERSPSFSVSARGYYCFGCHEGGDIFSFLQKYLAIGFLESVREVADIKGVKLDIKDASPEQDERTRKQREKQELAFRLNRYALKVFTESLLRTRSNPHLQYLTEDRKINSETIREFFIGCLPNQWDTLSKALKSAKAPLDLAEELGLIKPSPKHPGEYYDVFRGRLLFPVLDIRGKVLGFGGRILPEGSGLSDSTLGMGQLGQDKNVRESPKYLNSPSSFIYDKSKQLFGLHHAQKFIRELNASIVVEGYFDVVMMHQAGFRNSIATCGTALSPDQIKTLNRFGEDIVILFDGDNAGIEATERAMETGLEIGRALKAAFLPKGKDPDDLAFSDPEVLKKMVADASPLIDHSIQIVIKEIRDHALTTRADEVKLKGLNKVAVWLNMYRDPVGRALREDRFLKELELPKEIFEQALRSIGSRSGSNSLGTRSETIRPLSKVSGHNQSSEMPNPQVSRSMVGVGPGLTSNTSGTSGSRQNVVKAKAYVPLKPNDQKLLREWFQHPGKVLEVLGTFLSECEGLRIDFSDLFENEGLRLLFSQMKKKGVTFQALFSDPDLVLDLLLDESEIPAQGSPVGSIDIEKKQSSIKSILLKEVFEAQRAAALSAVTPKFSQGISDSSRAPDSQSSREPNSSTEIGNRPAESGDLELSGLTRKMLLESLRRKSTLLKSQLKPKATNGQSDLPIDRSPAEVLTEFQNLQRMIKKLSGVSVGSGYP